MTKAGIYKIQSPTDAVYIGQSSNIENRKKSYKKLNCVDQPRIYNSLLKHGWINHSFEVIMPLREDINQGMIDYWECFFMEYFKKENYDLMNVKAGGSNGKHSEETKNKIRKAHLGKKQSPEHVAKLTKARAFISDETRRKISLNHARLSGVNGPASKAVQQYDFNDVLIKEYDTINDAAESVNLTRRAIGIACKDEWRTSAGFKWKFKNKKK